MKWDETAGVEVNARARLPKLLARFYAAGREVLAHEDPDTLHQFRLRGKRVRYSLELFRPVYGPGLEKLLKKLRGAQTALGEINDCATARALTPSEPEFHSWLDQRESALRAEFRRYWLDEFDAPGEERRWLRYLAVYARKRPARRSLLQQEVSDEHRVNP
jgi:CHAD domain-containing protein